MRLLVELESRVVAFWLLLRSGPHVMNVELERAALRNLDRDGRECRNLHHRALFRAANLVRHRREVGYGNRLSALRLRGVDYAYLHRSKEEALEK